MRCMGDGRLLEALEKVNVLRLFFCFLRNSYRTPRLIARKLVRVLRILPEPRIIYEEGPSDMYVWVTAPGFQLSLVPLSFTLSRTDSKNEFAALPQRSFGTQVCINLSVSK